MRILHALEPSSGGVPAYVCVLVAHQRARGHDVAAVVSDGHGLPEQLQALGAEVVVAPWAPQITRPVNDLAVLRILRRTIGTFGPDLVHTHSNKAGVLGRLTARRARVPVVHTPHGFAYLTQARRPRKGRSARRWLTLNIERALAPLAAATVCVCEWERREALQARIGAPDRLRVVRNGIRLGAPARPHPTLASLRGDGPLVGFVARLELGKGPLLFLEAVRRLGSRAVIVGSGPDESLVRARAGDVPVQPFPGAADSVMAALDVYVLPTYFDALPLSVLEAMVAGLPVIATDVGGLSEMVLDGETGILVPPDDVEALSSAIARLVNDPAVRRRMGEAGREHCRAHFDQAAMLAGIDRVYDEVLSAL